MAGLHGRLLRTAVVEALYSVVQYLDLPQGHLTEKRGVKFSMMLSIELRRQLQVDRGVYVMEACDQCGKLLGPVRFTRRDDSGVWCSRECRDGVETAEQRNASRGGRPRKHKNNAEK